ncbi:hypothetical protein K1719_019087 [Acacia pycnantha]|nr:hypothetical protein K1719_019087 [Acacia pycnantha]
MTTLSLVGGNYVSRRRFEDHAREVTNQCVGKDYPANHFLGSLSKRVFFWPKDLAGPRNTKENRFNVVAKIKKGSKHDYPSPDHMDPNISSGFLTYLSHFKPLTVKPQHVTLDSEKPLVDLVKKIIEWVELHGDRAGYDDRAIVTGVAFAITCANKLFTLENSAFYVASLCCNIVEIFQSHSKAEKLRITVQEHYKRGIADGIIPVSTLILLSVSPVLWHKEKVKELEEKLANGSSPKHVENIEAGIRESILSSLNVTALKVKIDGLKMEVESKSKVSESKVGVENGRH